LPVSVNFDRAAELVGVSKDTLERAEQRGELRVLRTAPGGRGGRRLVTRDELAALLARWGSPSS
jgi:excisionase family DNA binding protein